MSMLKNPLAMQAKLDSLILALDAAGLSSIHAKLDLIIAHLGIGATPAAEDAPTPEPEPEPELTPPPEPPPPPPTPDGPEPEFGFQAEAEPRKKSRKG